MTEESMTEDSVSADSVTEVRPAGDRPAGDRPAGDRPAGDRPAGDRPAGDGTAADFAAEDYAPADYAAAGFRAWPDLAARSLGGSVVYASDEFYGPAHSLIEHGAADHDPAAFGPRGKMYDGWETRRRREPGTDFAIVRLAAPAVVRGVVIDTAHFRGNYPPSASVEGTMLDGYPDAAEVLAAPWASLVDKTSLEGNTAIPRAVTGPGQLVSHVRLTIDPDGGVARFRVHGEVIPDPRRLGGRVDLAATLAGGQVAGCSNMFFSAPANALAPGRATVMSDGWETARRRDDGHDWLVVTLGAAGVLHDVVIDTSRFVGNAPGWAALADDETGAELLGRTRLLPDTEHRFRLAARGPVRRVRLDIFPDGGISRLRLHGEVAPEAREPLAARWLSLLPADLTRRVNPAEFFS
jgi:allantoicase